MDNDNIFETYANSICEKSEYSDVYDNYEQVAGISNIKDTNLSELFNCNLVNSCQKIFIEKDNNIKKK